MWSNTARRTKIVAVASGVALASLIGAQANAAPSATPQILPLNADDLLVSRLVYVGAPGLLTPGQTVLPPGCTSGCATAVSDGTYPQVFNNALVDPSFGVTAPISLDEMTTTGNVVGTITVPAGDNGTGNGGLTDHLVGSFSSKSELALNLSPDGRSLTFTGYVAPVNAIDVSNSNTPGAVDPTNPVTASHYRAVAVMNFPGHFSFTETNAYSGNNARAAILNTSGQHPVIYAAGNAGNGGNPQPNSIIIGTGAQILNPQIVPEFVQTPGTPTPVGSFNITQLGDPPDKIGKDTNFNALAIHNNVLYYTKGSGGNGVNTVYFLDTTGTACPQGVGVPATNAALPTSGIAYDPNKVQTQGITPYNMCILKGFPTALKTTTFFPSGLWFADDNTLYVTQQGDGLAVTNTKKQHTGGLQKWTRQADGSWTLAYTVQAGLNLGTPYTVAGYPTGNNPATGQPWAPATDGLRAFTGRHNPDGSVTLYAVTAAISGSGDNGADPNKLVAVTDQPAATSPAVNEAFTGLRNAQAGEVLRGVTLTPNEGVVIPPIPTIPPLPTLPPIPPITIPPLPTLPPIPPITIP
ncbi:MAG: hypothetical protein JO296_16450 [Pseudonocardiales bacterium]|nr:hypothetical protein [Pseudonocardiales bacterium]